MLYHRPVLSSPDLGFVRAPGPGLGNLLFPIARAVIGAERMGGAVVRPTIRQFKLGTFLRNESDKRTYGDVFRHRSARELLLWARAAAVTQLVEGATIPLHDAAIRYGGTARYFHDLEGCETAVRHWIDGNARYNGVLDTTCDIAVHVRLGDFATGSGNDNVRIPLGWYAEAIELAKHTINVATPRIAIFSDGTPDELAELHQRYSMTPDPGRNALTSMRNISRARILVASRSTFSMWGAFLGGIPAIWDSTFDRSPFFPHRVMDMTL